MITLGHEKTDDETDLDQTPGAGEVEGHQDIEHEDGTTDQDGED